MVPVGGGGSTESVLSDRWIVYIVESKCCTERTFFMTQAVYKHIGRSERISSYVHWSHLAVYADVLAVFLRLQSPKLCVLIAVGAASQCY